MAAKPYHTGHHALVQAAAAENDQVILFVSTSDRTRKGEFPILGENMKRVWMDLIEPALPGNVSPEYGGSPVAKVYGLLENANEEFQTLGQHPNTYVIYSDPTDTAQNYPEKNRQQYFGDIYNDGNVLFGCEEGCPGMFERGVGTPDMSGTKMRQALQDNDLTTFTAGIPKGINAEEVFNRLRQSSVQELRKFVRSFLLVG